MIYTRTGLSILSSFFALACLFSLLELHPAEGAADGQRKQWGVYQIHRGAENFERGIREQSELLGAVPEYVLFFQDLSFRHGFPLDSAMACYALGATPVISQELWRWQHRHSNDDTWLWRISRGDFDAQWRDWARDAKLFEHRVILRFGFEMNGDWFDWGQQPEAFILAWRHVHQIVREEMEATNVEFMFSPNVEWDPSRPLTQIKRYYPGQDYVQMLGLDGYNFGDAYSQWHRWQSYAEVFEDSIEIMAQWPQPLFLAEIGSADGPRKANWLRDFLDVVHKDPRVCGFISTISIIVRGSRIGCLIVIQSHLKCFGTG
jgi:hypothetical protein